MFHILCITQALHYVKTAYLKIMPKEVSDVDMFDEKRKPFKGTWRNIPKMIPNARRVREVYLFSGKRVKCACAIF